MTGPEPEWLLPSWVRLVRARWAATGVSRADRAVLLDQLLQDLAAARAAGATVTELVATPPEVFADSCAAGLMSRSAGIDTASLLAVCLGSGMVAAGAAWFALKAGVQAISDSSLWQCQLELAPARRLDLAPAKLPSEAGWVDLRCGYGGCSGVPVVGGRAGRPSQ